MRDFQLRKGADTHLNRIDGGSGSVSGGYQLVFMDVLRSPATSVFLEVQVFQGAQSGGKHTVASHHYMDSPVLSASSDHLSPVSLFGR